MPMQLGHFRSLFFFMFHAATETVMKQINRNKTYIHNKRLHAHTCGRRSNCIFLWSRNIQTLRISTSLQNLRTTFFCLQNKFYLRLCQETHCILFHYTLLPLHMYTCFTSNFFPSFTTPNILTWAEHGIICFQVFLTPYVPIGWKLCEQYCSYY